MKALITGAGHGLGRALSRTILETPESSVIGIDLDLAALEELGPKITPLMGDLGDSQSLQMVCQKAVDAGPFDLVVMNAGINATGRFQDIPLAMQRPIIDVNMTAPMAMTAALLSGEAVTPGATLIYVSSLSHFTGYPGAATYAASKDGLAAFARSLRRPLSARNIHILTVCPGPLDTAHAARHAPPGSPGTGRMPPAEAARLIIAAAGRSGTLVPGVRNRLMALSGRLAPAWTTRMARNVLFVPFLRGR